MSELGRGGMGVVFLARDQELDRLVALKVLADHLSESDDFRARFAREMRIAIKLEHPNVVPVYETGQTRGHMFIAMRYVDGPDFGRVLLERDHIEAAHLVRLAIMLGSALDAAHTLGLVHRDVKPGNVLLTQLGMDEHLYLTDFGLAREMVADQGLTHTGQWMGTADYISPEQLDGRPVSARSDIYSMTCVLYRALAGTPPYPGQMVVKLKGHALDPLPSVGQIHRRAREIDAVLARGAAKDADARYPSAGDLARAFRSAVAGEEPDNREREVATGAALSGIWTAGNARLERRVAERSPRESDATPTIVHVNGPPIVHDPRSLTKPQEPPTRDGRSIATHRRTVAATTAVFLIVAIAAAVLFVGSGGKARTEPPALSRSTGGGPRSTPDGDRFTLATRGHFGSVWFVRRGDPQWSSTGVFTTSGNPSIATGESRTIIAARAAKDGTIWYARVGTPEWVPTGSSRAFVGASDPAVSVGPSGRITVADRGTDNRLWYTQPGIGHWTSLGTFTAIGNPSIATGDGRTVIAARAMNGTIWYARIGTPGWISTGNSSEFIGAGDPGVSVGPSGQITIAEGRSDHTLWYIEPGIGHWRPLGTFTAIGNPSIATGDGRTIIAARAAKDGTIWYARLGTPGWLPTGSTREFVGASDPAVSVGPTGQITVADRGTDNTVWYVQPGTRPWTILGAFIASGNPSLVPTASTR